MTHAARLLSTLPDAIAHPSWRWSIAEDAPLAEVTWSAPGWPGGGVLLDMSGGDNATRAALGYAIRSYEAAMRVAHGPPPDDVWEST